MQNEAEDGKPPPKLDEVGSFEEKITQLESQAAFTSRLILEMPCVRFNQYIKEHGLSDKEVKEMKEARRRMKNRLYGNPKPTISSLHPHTDERQAPRQQSRTRTRPSAPLCTSPPTSHPASAAVDHVPMLGKEVFSTIRGSGSDSP